MTQLHTLTTIATTRNRMLDTSGVQELNFNDQGVVRPSDKNELDLTETARSNMGLYDHDQAMQDVNYRAWRERDRVGNRGSFGLSLSPTDWQQVPNVTLWTSDVEEMVVVEEEDPDYDQYATTVNSANDRYARMADEAKAWTPKVKAKASKAVVKVKPVAVKPVVETPEVAASVKKAGGIRPRRSTPTPTQVAVVSPILTEKPDGADWLGRLTRQGRLLLLCQCGCEQYMLESVARVPNRRYMANKLDRPARAWDLWRFAQTPACSGSPGFSFMEAVTKFEKMAKGLESNNTLLTATDDPTGPSHRLSSFVIPLPEGNDGLRVRQLLNMRTKTRSDWNELKMLVGLERELKEVMAMRIPKWEANGRRDVMDLRVFTDMSHTNTAWLKKLATDEAAFKVRSARRTAFASHEMSFGDDPAKATTSATTAMRKRQQLSRKHANTPPAHKNKSRK